MRTFIYARRTQRSRADLSPIANLLRRGYIRLMTLAEWIKSEGITRSSAARRLGVSPSYLTELCQGKRFPSAGLACRIVDESEGLVTLRELVNGPKAAA